MPGPSLPPRQTRAAKGKASSKQASAGKQGNAIRKQGAEPAQDGHAGQPQSTGIMNTQVMNGSPSAMSTTGASPLQAMLPHGVNPLQGGDPTAAFQQQAGAISQLPIMQKLLSDPGDPNLQHLARMAQQAPPQAGPIAPGIAGMPPMPPWMASMMSQEPHPLPGQHPFAFPMPGHASQPDLAASSSYPGDPGPSRNGSSTSSSSSMGRRYVDSGCRYGAEPASDGTQQPEKDHESRLRSREHSFRELPQPEGRGLQPRAPEPANSASFSFQQPPHDQQPDPMQPGWNGLKPTMMPPHSIPNGPAHRDPHSEVAPARDDSLLIPGARWVSPEELWKTQQQLQREAAAAGPDMSLGGVPGQMLAVAGQMEPALFGTATADPSPAHGSALQPPGLPMSYSSRGPAGSQSMQAPQAHHLEGQVMSQELEPPHRKYFTHADAVYPPAFVTLLAAVCYWRLVPPLALLILLLPLFLVGLQCFIVEGQGMRPAKLVASRFTASLVAALQVAHLLTFMNGMFQSLQDHSLAAALFVALCALLPLLQWRLIKMDPGFLESPVEGSSPASTASESPTKPPGFSAHPRNSPSTCYTCSLKRPLRSKHCATCNRCVERFDHHCPVICGCVGASNQRSFMAFIICMLLGQALWLRLALLFFHRSALHALSLPLVSQLTAGAVFSSSLRLHPGKMLLTLIQVPLVVGNALLVCRQAAGIAANLTANEMLARQRYAYLFGHDGRYLNLFDQGPLRNLAQWARPEHPDWDVLYAARQQEMDAGGQPKVPRLSITRVIRDFLQYQEALRVARAQKQQDREDQLLRRYGCLIPKPPLLMEP
ncbi:hypothetical protein WJX74_002731 [Apatococcus lobatus]|uniref:S-acyltransferase n=1 Tax=Apatococcus lobatus TaxID=904363 RepID=A0AAW1SDV0_9CHLO